MRHAGLIAGLVLFLGLSYGVRGYVIDDTFIHLQYAKNLRAGLGLVFNPGEAVAGTTSPMWSVLLGWLPSFGIDLVLWSKLLGWLAALASLFLFWKIANRFLLRPEHAAAATVAWAVNVWMARWSTSGMETSLAVLLVLAGWSVAYGGGNKETAISRRFLTGLLWGLATLTRPEVGLLLFAYTVYALLWPKGTLQNVALGHRIASSAGVVAGAAVALAPFAVYALITYGSVLPGTLSAKTAGGVDLGIAVARLVHSAKIVGASSGIEAMALILLALFLRSPIKRGDPALHLACLSWILLVPLGFAARGVPVISRYLVPLLPLIVLYGWGALESWRLAGDTSLRRNAIAVALALTLGINAYVYRSQVLPHTQQFVDAMERTLIPWGRWLAVNTPSDAVVATPDIGAIGYYGNRRILDLGGLVDPEIVRLRHEMSYEDMVRDFAFRHVGRPEYLIDRRPGPGQLLHESPFAPALSVIFTERASSLGVSMVGPVDYTLYRVSWSVVDSLAARAEVAGRTSATTNPDAAG